MTLLDSSYARHRQFRRFFTLQFSVLFSVLFLLLAIPGIYISSAMAKPVAIVAFGDSLTAGYGLAAEDAYPVKLEAALRARGYDVTITNAGVSGDTSTGGLARLDWSIGKDVDLVILELGANDALRGIDPDVTRKSLTEIVKRLRASGKKILLAGMLAPPNLGQDYGDRFKAIFTDLGKLEGVILYPFFLEGVAGRPKLNQHDGLHPTAKGVEEIVRRLLPVIEPMLK